MKKNKLLIPLMLFTILFTGCSSNTSSNNLDKEFENASRRAAEKVLKNEIEEYSWTTVETGELEYKYTLYNEGKDVYKSIYLTEFDVEDEPEDIWIEIGVTLTSKTKSVQDTETSYLGAREYEHFVIPSSVESKGEKWVNINVEKSEE